MGALLDLLARKKLLVSDGAWGTMLQQAGLSPLDCPEEWNVSHPDAVRAVAAAYAKAGSDLVLTNTFGASRIKLEKMGLAERTREFNLAGAQRSLEGAPKAVVAASVGCTGELLQPFGLLTPEDLDVAYSEQFAALFETGLKAVCIETMTVLEEAVIAVRAARKLNAKADIICTMTFGPVADGYRTVMGVGIEQAAEALSEAGADILGANCGNGIDRMVDIARAFKACTARPILIHANAGLPELVGDKTVFRETPEMMAARIPDLVAAGAVIVGGCCGTTPAHISAMRAAVDKLR